MSSGLSYVASTLRDVRRCTQCVGLNCVCVRLSERRLFLNPRRPRLARVRPPAALRQEVRRGHQVLPQRSEVGQGQPADPPRPVAAADPDAGPGGLQGERNPQLTGVITRYYCCIYRNGKTHLPSSRRTFKKYVLCNKSKTNWNHSLGGGGRGGAFWNAPSHLSLCFVQIGYRFLFLEGRVRQRADIRLQPGFTEQNDSRGI